MEAPYDARFLRGVDHFNCHEFFEAHEAWEELWMDVQGGGREFYKGLIQVAVCLHHFGNGNTRGARKLFHSSRTYLAAYGPSYAGIDLDRFLAQLDRCCSGLTAGDVPPSGTQLDPCRIPRIDLRPPTEGTATNSTE